MTPEQRVVLADVTEDVTAAQALTARAAARADTGGAHGGADVARGALARALDELRAAAELLRKVAMNE